MRNPANIIPEIVLPHTRTLWERGSATVDEETGIPYFGDLHIEGIDYVKTGRIIDHTDTDIGEHQTFDVRFNQGDRHEVRVNRLDTRYSSSVPLLGHNDLAYLTLQDGINEYFTGRDSRLTGLDNISVGSNHGTSQDLHWRDLLKVPSTAREAVKGSMARSAFKSQLMTNEFQVMFDLPRQIVKRGKSQGSMWVPSHYAYAPLVGNDIVYSDSEAPCIPEKLFEDPKDILRFSAWLTAEALSVMALAVQAKRKGIVSRYKGTTRLDPNFMISNIVGGAPALASGEFGHSVPWVPKNSPMHFEVYGLDFLSRLDVLKEQFANHPYVDISSPERWWLTHNSGITDEEEMDRGSMRVNAFQDVFVHKPDPETRTADDYAQIFSMEPGEGYSIPHAA